MIYALIVIIGLAAVFVWLNLYGLDIIAEKKATHDLEQILFPKGLQQKEQVLASIHRLTNNRLTDAEAIDYFFKIKGLQVINLHDPINFWVRKYLMANTRTKLNYFEQVRFYEEFLNYPEGGKRSGRVIHPSISSYPLTEAAQELIKTGALTSQLA